MVGDEMMSRFGSERGEVAVQSGDSPLKLLSPSAVNPFFNPYGLNSCNTLPIVTGYVNNLVT